MNYNKLTKSQLIDIIFERENNEPNHVSSLFLYRHKNGRLFITDEEPHTLNGEVYPQKFGYKLELNGRMFSDVEPGTCKGYYTV